MVTANCEDMSPALPLTCTTIVGKTNWEVNKLLENSCHINLARSKLNDDEIKSLEQTILN